MGEDSKNGDGSKPKGHPPPTRRMTPDIPGEKQPPTRRMHPDGTPASGGGPPGADRDSDRTRKMDAADTPRDSAGQPAPTRKMDAAAAPPGAGRPADERTSPLVHPATRPTGEVINGRYVIVEKMAKGGGQADLYLCDDSENPGQQVVLKIYWGELQPETRILKALKGIRHEDIIAFLDFGVLAVEGRFFEAMEYAAGGSLSDRLPDKCFSEQELTGTVIPEIINGLKYCHDNGIIHRDIKESNLYYRNADGTDVVLGDFGISSMLRGDESIHFTERAFATWKYAAPEVYPFSSGGITVGKEMDYYALGISLIQLTGTDPFPGVTEPHRQFPIKMRNAVPLPENISDRFAAMLRGLLHPVPTMRWGYDEIQRWLAGEDVTVAPTGHYAPVGFEYKIGDAVPRTLEELALVLLDHQEEAIEDIGRGALAKAIDQFDVNTGREVFRIIDKDTPIESRYLEIVYTLDPTLPYRFAPGREAHTPRELARLIDGDGASWREGISQLFSGYITIWLNAIGETERADAWNSRLSEFADIEILQDAAMETFLQILDPDIGSPRIKLSRRSVDVRLTDSNPQTTVDITISNAGRGHLHGSVNLGEQRQGIMLQTTRIDANRFGGRESVIRLSIDVRNWERGKPYRSKLTLNTNGGKHKIPLRISNSFPAWDVIREMIIYAFLGGILAFIVRGIHGFRDRTDWLSNHFGHYIGWHEATNDPLWRQFEFAVSLVVVIVAVWIVSRRARAARSGGG